MYQTKLFIKICNKKPMELNALTNSLNALVKEYDAYCKDNFDMAKSERKLEILKLESGSLLLELVPIAISIIQDVDVALSFGTHVIGILDYFVGKTDKMPPNISKKTCDNLSAFVDQTANDHGSNAVFNVLGNNNTIIAERNYSSLELNAAQNGLLKHKESLLGEEPHVKYKQAFYWVTASFVQSFHNGLPDKTNQNKNSTDKGIIEQIDKKPHKIIFANDEDKILITRFCEKHNKEWQELIYIVDVEIIIIQDVVKMYKILKVYYDETTDPDNS